MNKENGIGMSTIVLLVLAYFVYGENLSSVLGMFLLIIGSGITTILSIIPFIGVILTYIVNTTYTYPTIMGFVGLTPTWLTTLLLWFHTLTGVVITLITTWAVLKVKR